VNVAIIGTNTKWDNPDRHERMMLESYFSRKRAIVETMRIGLTSADMPIPELH